MAATSIRRLIDEVGGSVEALANADVADLVEVELPDALVDVLAHLSRLEAVATARSAGGRLQGLG